MSSEAVFGFLGLWSYVDGANDTFSCSLASGLEVNCPRSESKVFLDHAIPKSSHLLMFQPTESILVVTLEFGFHKNLSHRPKLALQGNTPKRVYLNENRR